MKDLYAPWRSSYARTRNKTKKENTKKSECVFCIHEQNNNEKHFILKRYKHCYAILNKYPYNAGHILVVPFIHVKDLTKLDAPTRHEIIDVASLCARIAQKKLKCSGINMGLNLGKTSGAGILNHMHMHVLPRWEGDTNFLPTLAHTKVISFDLKEIYKLLKPAFV